MKKVINSKIFIFILGIIIASASIVSAYTLFANNIGFESKDESWNVENVKEALDGLYETVNGKFEFLDSGSTIGTSSTSERTITKELDVGEYIVMLNEFNTNELAGASTNIRLDNEKNSFTLIQSDNKYSARSYAASSVISSYYLIIKEKGNAVFIGRDVYNYSGGGAGLIYQIYKIK